MEGLNFRNINLEEKDILEIFRKGGIEGTKVNEINHYQIAFTNKSYANRQLKYSPFLKVKFEEAFVEPKEESNERYEFYGDSVINTTICEYLFIRYPTKTEGFMTKLKSKLISTEYFAKFARYLGFNKFLLLSNHLENINGRELDTALEDALEAFICALKLDNGYETTRTFIFNLLENNVNFSKIIFNNDNYKDRLIKHSQKTKIETKFILMSSLGQSYQKSFVVGIYMNKQLKAVGFSTTTLLEAEHQGAKTILEKLKLLGSEELKVINS